MRMQDLVWWTSLVLMGAVSVTFLLVAAGAGSTVGDGSLISRTAYVWRARLFWVVLLAGVLLSIATLWTWPFAGHAHAAPRPDVTIHAEARQWSWHLDRDTVQAGELVEFVVTASDVNHGFAIYRDKTHLVAQTQAMPGYQNRLRVRFSEPGEYEVLCLEYCGVGHHLMRTTVKVTAP